MFLERKHCCVVNNYRDDVLLLALISATEVEVSFLLSNTGSCLLIQIYVVGNIDIAFFFK